MPSTRVAFALLCALLFGCASEPDPFSHFRAPPPGMAMVVLYRVDRAENTSADTGPSVLVNGRATWPLLPGRYLHEVVPPGQIALVVQKRQVEGTDGANWRAYSDATVEFNAHVGNTYFVELGLGVRTFSFQQTDIVTALGAVRTQRRGN